MCRKNHPHVLSAISGPTGVEQSPPKCSFLWLSCSWRHWVGPRVLPELLFFAAPPQTLSGTRWGTTHSTAPQEKPLQTEIRPSCTSQGALPHALDMTDLWFWGQLRLLCGGTWRRKGASRVSQLQPHPKALSPSWTPAPLLSILSKDAFPAAPSLLPTSSPAAKKWESRGNACGTSIGTRQEQHSTANPTATSTSGC